MAKDPLITIAIPAYNAERTLARSIMSALDQVTRCKVEVLVLNDGSTDCTTDLLECWSTVRVINKPFNEGIGRALETLMQKAKGKYIIYLCADDQFVDNYVVRDYLRVFQSNEKLGVIGRYFYQYLDGYDGPIQVSRDKNILRQSCCPSGMAFKRDPRAKSTNDIFVECPTMVAWYLRHGYEWTMFEYDTVKARIHPGGNTGTKTEYYKGSMYQNWYDLLGEPLGFYEGLIQIKNRAGRNLWNEIRVIARTDKKAFTKMGFWLCVTIAVIVPGCVLRPLSNFWRHRVWRRNMAIIKRGNI